MRSYLRASAYICGSEFVNNKIFTKPEKQAYKNKRIKTNFEKPSSLHHLKIFVINNKTAPITTTIKTRYIRLTNSRIAMAKRASTPFRRAIAIKSINAMMRISLRST